MPNISASEKAKLKIILLGDGGVGKTSLFKLYFNNIFSAAYEPTIGADFLIKMIETEKRNITVHVWDTAGQERFQPLGLSSFPDADAFIIAFDLTNITSFQSIQSHLAETTNLVGSHMPIMLVGMKSDLNEYRTILQSDIVDSIKRLKKDFPNLQDNYCEISAKDNTCVEYHIHPNTNVVTSTQTTGVAHVFATLLQLLIKPLASIEDEVDEVNQEKTPIAAEVAPMPTYQKMPKLTTILPKANPNDVFKQRLLLLRKNINHLKKLYGPHSNCIASLNQLADILILEKDKEGKHTLKAHAILKEACKFTKEITSIDKLNTAINTFTNHCNKEINPSTVGKLGRAVTIVAIAFLGFSLGLMIGGLIGLGAGAWAGPVAMLSAFVGMLKGAADGAAIGVSIGAGITGLGIGAVSTFMLFKKNPLQQSISTISTEFMLIKKNIDKNALNERKNAGKENNTAANEENAARLALRASR
jgi:small GTP-binding protein